MSPCLMVVDAGLSTTIQDRGRFGSQRFGLSTSGALDVLSLAIANQLVGNDPAAEALEFTVSGGVYEVAADAIRIALAGADMPVAVAGTSFKAYRSHVLRRGDRIEIGPARSGLRAYLAVAGGIRVAPVLGSRSTHVRSGLGGIDGRPLRAGDAVPLSEADVGGVALQLRPDREPYFGGVVHIVPGPQDDAFHPEAMRILTEGRYRMSSWSDRMAALLDGPSLPFRDGFNIVSDGVAMGSIQVPGHGRPLVLLSDRQTTGGYPKIATVTTPDIGRFAQRRPNERVVFAVISPDAAEERYIRWRMQLDAVPDWLQRI